MPDASTMTPEQLAFAAAARTASLATIGTNGRPRLVPICFVVGSASPDGRSRFYSSIDEKPKRSTDPHDLARVRDLLVLPEATVLVDRWSEDWSRLAWLRLECRGEILEPEPRERAEHAAAVGALRAKYEQYRDHRLEERPIIRFIVDRVRAWGDLSDG